MSVVALQESKGLSSFFTPTHGVAESVTSSKFKSLIRNEFF